MNLEEQRLFVLEGNVYNDLTPELKEARRKAIILTNKYNDSYDKSVEERDQY